MQTQRFAALALIAACGAPGPHATAPGPVPPVVAAYPATRWVPERPTYVLAAHTFADAQSAIVRVLDTVANAPQASQMLQSVLAVDPLSPDATSALGIAGDGPFAVFSEGIDPTFVIQLASPDAFTGFVAHLRERGLVTQSVQVDGVELLTASLGRHARVSWAIDHGWLWAHFRLVGTDDTAWFTHSRHAASAPWAADLAWAEHAASKALIGWIGARELVGQVLQGVPQAVACVKLVEPIRRVGLDVAPGELRLAVDLGASAREVEQHVLAPPPGWTAVAGGAPLAVQWNVDLEAAQRWIAPCGNAIGFSLDLGELNGLRTARAVLQTFDPDGPSGTGVLAADASSTKRLSQLLDQIPGRSLIEKDRKFGPLSGHRLSIPFKVSIDYVLQDHLAMAAIGDGLLERAATGTPSGAPPLAAVDLAPPKLSAAAWKWLLEAAEVPHAQQVAERMRGWTDAHLTAAIDRDDLVIQLTGNRR